MKKYSLDVIVMVFTDGPVVPGSPVPVFGGPYPGFSEPSNPGENDKDLLVRKHLQVFKVQYYFEYISSMFFCRNKLNVPRNLIRNL